MGHLRHDLIGGITVALILVPQSMAYAQLAGLPAYYGLYAAFLPPLVASLFGSSRQLATGPVAIVSLMTATALEPMATLGSESFIAYAILLALLIGIFQFLLGVFKLGLVVNFLSHPVVNGFTNAGALIIASSQLSKIFGVKVDSATHHYETIYNVIVAAVSYTHWPTLGIAVAAFLIMIVLKKINPKIPNVLVAVVVTTVISWSIGFEHNHNTSIDQIMDPDARLMLEEFNNAISEINIKSDSRVELTQEMQKAEEELGDRSVKALELHHRISVLNIEIGELKDRAHDIRESLRQLHFCGIDNGDGNILFYDINKATDDMQTDGRNWRIKVGNNVIEENQIRMSGGGDVVGDIPKGLPGFKFPNINFGIIFSLFPMAVVISLLGFMEAISIAKAMAARTGQKLDPNRELIGQGLANISGSFFSSYAVSGSFSRSAVNIQAGAFSGLSNVFSSCVVVATLLFFTPLLYHLPQAVLAAIIMMAVIGLINVSGFIHAWKAQKYDGAISIITFLTTLAFAPHLDRGIMIGIGLSLLLYLLRGMKPNIALLSMHPDGTYRNRMRFKLAQCKHIAVIRYNGSLFFASVNYLEEKVLERISRMHQLRHILIVGNGINELDASGEDMLSILVSRIREAGYDISFSGLNDAVIDTLHRTHLYEKIGEDHFYRNATRAVNSIYAQAHMNSDEEHCPLHEVVTDNNDDSNIVQFCKE
ncbi:MAG: SulP family inorganic anion transporter [Candidatus Zixiibacteriota bacterium]